MGDIADMMLDGTMCQMCGEFIGDPVGYPITCAGCRDDERGIVAGGPANTPKDPKTVECPEPLCERKFRSRQAAAQHWVDKHE